MYNFQLIKYYNTKSDLHKMNPFYKLICLLAFTILIIFASNIFSLLFLFLFSLVIIDMSKIPLKYYAKNILFLVPFILFIFIINIIFNITFISSLISILKLILFVIYSSVIMYTTKPNELTYGLEKLFSPLKSINIPVKSLALTISLSIRFIPVIFEQTDKVIKSQLSRGLDFKGNLKSKIDKLISVILPIFNLSLKRADSISNTLDMRLYIPEKERTMYKNYNNYVIDNSIILMHIFLVIIYAVLEAFI